MNNVQPETKKEGIDSKAEPKAKTRETLVDAVFDMGLSWAEFGVSQGKQALSQGAKTLERVAKSLDDLQRRLHKD
jgi:hypothetical protein